VLIAIIGMSKILRRQDGPAPNTVASSVSAGSTAVPAESSLKPSPPAKNTPDKQTTSVAEEKQGPTSALPLPETPAAAPAVLRSNETKPASAPKTSSVALGRGDVLDQILPKPSTSALATIQGTVRVGVRVHVDEAGNVSEALLDSPGPSKYFADLSLKAARGWVFSSPEADGRDVPSDWLLHFYFTQSGVHATANQTKP
jgi:outer membrane biosynthesis protein TonB